MLLDFRELTRYQHTETNTLICRANQFTGFYMMATLAVNELIFVVPLKHLVYSLAGINT